MKNRKNILILIPARYASSRFPGKPLVEIAGKSMIEHVYANCSQTGFDVAVVTDSSEIENHVKSFGGTVCRVDENVPSGTERIRLAYERFYSDQGYDLVLNVQGDEPLLQKDDLINLSEFHLNSDFNIGTLVSKQSDLDGFKDINRVKVIFCKITGQCLYFSRASIPYSREGNMKEWFLHIGVYSYRPEDLTSFAKEDLSYYEDLEKLEQLRALEMGLKIGAVTTTSTLLGVDTPEDIKKVEGVMSGQAE